MVNDLLVSLSTAISIASVLLFMMSIHTRDVPQGAFGRARPDVGAALRRWYP
jgi:hypothetical protein